MAIGAGALTAPFASFAQQSGKVWRVGVLGAGSPSGWAPMVEALRAGLRELGYIEGSNINIDYRWADGQYDRLPELETQIHSHLYPLGEIENGGAFLFLDEQGRVFLWFGDLYRLLYRGGG